MAGVAPVNAHLLCFWLSMSSNLTPPVCIAAFAAASISGGNPMKTGVQSFILGIFMYLMPFAFVYVPQILIVGYGFFEIAEVVLSYAFATVALAATVQLAESSTSLSPHPGGDHPSGNPELVTDLSAWLYSSSCWDTASGSAACNAGWRVEKPCRNPDWVTAG